MGFININGKFFEEGKAVISVKDRGFRFGDGIFDTVRVVDGEVFREDIYFDRIKQGLAAIKLKFDESILHKEFGKTIKKNELENGFLRVSITRGEGSRGYLPTDNGSSTMVIESMPLRDMEQTEGKLMVSSYKKPSLNSLPVNFKLMQGLNSTLAKMEARENGFFDALLLNEDGNISECSSSNIFWITKGKIYTPSLKSACLDGVIRRVIIENFEVSEGDYSPLELKKADEVFITNSVIGVFPIFETKDWFFNKVRKYTNTSRIKNFVSKQLGD